jgi:arsenical pump membrane protein
MNIIAILVIMLISIFLAIKPLKIKNISIPFVVSSFFLLAILYSNRVLTNETIARGIIGNGQIKPWEIMVIFFSVAFTSISVDATGIFDYLAYHIVRKTKGNGIKLFVFFYLFAGILTLFTSNDIVILTLTPIIFYLSKHANINIIPYLYVQFFSANTMSMLLYIGNPTNIIIGNALGFGFWRYSQIMWLPTIVATLANFLFLFLIFRSHITRHYTIHEQSNFKIENHFLAISSSALLLLMLSGLAFSQTFEWEIWKVTLLFAIIFLLLHLALILISAFQKLKSVILKSKISNMVSHKNQHFLIFIFQRMPWKILPFITVFFIYVQGLQHYGVVDLIASISARFSQNLLSGIVVNGFSSLLLANIINNQPMTIFMSSVLVSNSFIVPESAFLGSAYAVIIASNLAANITYIGALAGMMWKKILSNKGLYISYWDFFKKGILITPLVFILTLLTLNYVLANG